MVKINAEELLNEINIIDVVSKHVPLHKRSGEHVGKCPFHQDEHDSLQVNERKQIYKCFPCGAGGDAIDFVMRMGASFHDACNELSSGDFQEQYTPEQREAAKKTRKTWEQIVPAPNPPASMNHYRHGTPSKSWAYRDPEGKLIGYVCRFDLPHGKEVIPYTYATDGSVSEWRWMGLKKPRPLYNLHLIKRNPKASILLVEGEKTADAAQAQLDPSKTIATTWIGGSNAIDLADFTMIQGRGVIYWPDNDTEARYGETHAKAGEVKPYLEQPGNLAMFTIHQKIKNAIRLGRWVNNPEDLPHKWDAADKEWEPGELGQFVRDNMGDVPAPQLAVPTRGKDQAPPPKKADPPSAPGDHDEQNYYSILGYDKDENRHPVFYFYSYLAKCVFKYGSGSLNKPKLITMAPLNYWEEKFPGGKTQKINLDQVQQYLMGTAFKVGQFNEKFIRGRGAWQAEDRMVIHTGNELIIDRKPFRLNALKSRYVYEIGEKLGLGSDKILPNRDAAKLIDHLKWLRWDREVSAYLMAGWCIIAPFCGILRWRPHVWITGAAGSGKSWVMDNIVKTLLGESAIVVQGKTTEAGVRGLLQSDARPVLFDESDVDSHNDKERIQNILALARSSSYHDGGVIGKGTQSGMSKTYVMRSCFAFSSIGVQLNQQSDRSRFTMLGLMSFEGHRTEEDFINYERDWHNTITEDWVQQLQARTISLLPVIMKNAKTFADAVSHVLKQKRIGDQVGAMLAGAYSLISSTEISYDDAVAWVNEREWEDERGLELTKDESQLFNRIIGFSLRAEGQYSQVERTVGELMLISIGKIHDPGISDASAIGRLRRCGILINGDRIYISNTGSGVKAIVKDSAWSNNHNRILERLPGAEKLSQRVYYPGCNSRGISLPLSMVTDGYEPTEYKAAAAADKNQESMNFYEGKDTDPDDLPF